MVEITARWVINTVNSVQSITGQANTHYTDECHMYNPDGSRKYKRVSPIETRRRTTFLSSYKLSKIRSRI